MIAHSPTRLTPLHQTHLSMGAVMGDVDGWQLPLSYDDPDRETTAIQESVGICDITGSQIQRVKSRQPENVPPVGTVVENGGLTMARLTDDETLIIGSAELSSDLRVIDITSGYARFKIAGPESGKLLSAMTDIDLRDRSMPNLTCAQAGFAGVHGTLLRIDIGSTPAYELLVSREFADYAWHTAIESLPAGTVVPIGFEVLNAVPRSSE
jgi:glycine cleavage system aminomethyltransferase T